MLKIHLIQKWQEHIDRGLSGVVKKTKYDWDDYPPG